VTEVEPALRGALPLPDIQDHGASHIRRVCLYAEILAYEYGADPLAAVVAGYCHDVGRLRDGKDPEHGRRGWEMSRETLNRQFPHLVSCDLQFAIEHHTAGWTSDIPLIAALWDADRIDLMRFGRPPVLHKLDASRMSRPLAMALAERVIGLNLAYSLSWQPQAVSL
jgi:HD superfamily phosphohydrolase YqeK